MVESPSIYPIIFGIIASGLVATTFMTLFAESFSKSGVISVDLVRAIGAIFVRNPNSFFRVGATVHTVSGIFFAFVYTFILLFLGVGGTGPLTAVGALIGAAHGFVLSIMLIISVAEHHPIEKYRNVGPGIAAVYFLGHIIYGAAIGLLLGVLGVIS